MNCGISKYGDERTVSGAKNVGGVPAFSEAYK